MIKKNLKLLIITSIVILLPIIAGVVLWDKLPDKLPIHWNINNEVDGYASKPFFVFGFPLIMVALQWLCVLATYADPKKQNYSDKILVLVFWLIPTLTLVLMTVTYLTVGGQKVRMDAIMPIFMGLIFAIIGNYLPKCKQSYTIGIKLPWTLNSEENWNKTHRLAGWLWVAGGIIIITSGFISSFVNSFIILISALLIMVIVPTIYSFILFKKGI